MKVTFDKAIDGPLILGFIMCAILWTILSKPWVDTHCAPVNLGGQGVLICGEVVDVPEVPTSDTKPAAEPPAESKEKEDEDKRDNDS